MAGNFRSNEADRKRDRALAIEAWMLSNVTSRGYERYDDLHIDRIDQMWHSRDTWIEAGFEALRLATELRDQRKLSFVPVLAYSLKSARYPQGVDFETLGEFTSRLDSSPPSLYLFRDGHEPWAETSAIGSGAIWDGVLVEPLSPALFGIGFNPSRCYYMEFKQVGAGEYSRSVFIAG